MNKKFCKNCYGKLYCTHNIPQMNANNIINSLLSNITSSTKQNNLHTIYKFLLPEYRQKFNGFKGFQSFIQKKFPYLLQPLRIQLVKAFEETDECHGEFIIQTTHKPYFIKIYLQRAYNFIDNKPLYDPITKEYLHLYWRIALIKKTGDTKNNSNIIYSRF